MNKFQMNNGEVKFHHDGTATETHKRPDGSSFTQTARSIHPGRFSFGDKYNPQKRISN